MTARQKAEFTMWKAERAKNDSYDKLMNYAESLEEIRNTTPEDEIDGREFEFFAERLEAAREAGTITHEEYVTIALTAFYDYDIVEY